METVPTDELSVIRSARQSQRLHISDIRFNNQSGATLGSGTGFTPPQIIKQNSRNNADNGNDYEKFNKRNTAPMIVS